MRVKPIFVSQDSLTIIEHIRGPSTVFTIRQNGYDELLLECEVDLDEHFRFYIEYSEDIASGINREVMYQNGWIEFTEESESETESDTDFHIVMRVTDDDYTVPIDEDIEECPVCYELYEPMYGSVCGHHTCVDCMIRMDEMGLTNCPLCRSGEFRFPVAVACNRMFVTV